jgi:hypothetical protein
MLIFVFWATDAQIWKYRPRSPDLKKQMENFIFLHLPHQYAYNKPLTTFWSGIVVEIFHFLYKHDFYNFGPHFQVRSMGVTTP